MPPARSPSAAWCFPRPRSWPSRSRCSSSWRATRLSSARSWAGRFARFPRIAPSPPHLHASGRHRGRLGGRGRDAVRRVDRVDSVHRVRVVRHRVRRGHPGRDREHRGDAPGRLARRDAVQSGLGDPLAGDRAVRGVLAHRRRAARATAGAVCPRGWSLRARPRAFATGLWAFPLATAALAMLSLYRESLGLPLSYLSLLTLVLIWTIQATSWNILCGFSGYFSFGQAAYVGPGAYATAVFYGRHGVSFYVTVVLAAGLCALLALAIGEIG